MDDLYGFAPPCVFRTVVALVEHFSYHTLATYNKKLDVMLSYPVSRFSTDEGEDEDVVMESKEAENDQLLEELREVSTNFNNTSQKYQQLEDDENYVKEVRFTNVTFRISYFSNNVYYTYV